MSRSQREKLKAKANLKNMSAAQKAQLKLDHYRNSGAKFALGRAKIARPKTPEIGPRQSPKTPEGYSKPRKGALTPAGGDDAGPRKAGARPMERPPFHGQCRRDPQEPDCRKFGEIRGADAEALAAFVRNDIPRGVTAPGEA